jgi:hypothetical protein
MATATERVPVLVTPNEKALFVSKAKSIGISVGELMRRAAGAYKSSEEDKLLEAMITQMNKATDNTQNVIDETLLFVAQSNERIAKMEAAAKSDV